MDKIMKLADQYKLFVVEDAAQAIDSYYTFPDGTRKPLGGIGHLGAFSFHETKNIQCGEGGMLIINDPQFNLRAEIIREKGTNRSAFFRGEADKYGWVDIGSSFLPSELNAAFLYAQLEHLDEIQNIRKAIWNTYFTSLKVWADDLGISMPFIPHFASNNAHMFYLVCKSLEQRTVLINTLKEHQILSVFHYLSLHKSRFFQEYGDNTSLFKSDYYTDHLVRLPFYVGLKNNDLQNILQVVLSFR
jgi:dTDP-4-amino-4,6-dideoxygalactose transaminase